MDKYYKKVLKKDTCNYSLPLLFANLKKVVESDIDFMNIEIAAQKRAYSRLHDNANYSVKKFEKHVSRMIREFNTTKQ